MKSLIPVFILIISSSFTGNTLSLEDVRKNYQVAVSDKETCWSMISQLRNSTASNVHLAYLGAFQAVWANHISNPISKLNTFNEGKKNIENAVKRSPDNVEIIFIRYSVQKNCPAFLGYRSNVAEDRAFLSRNTGKITSDHLKKMIEGLLKN